jgi:hypothetical protein
MARTFLLLYRVWYTSLRAKSDGEDARLSLADDQGKRIPAIFYRTEARGEPVREWLRGLAPDDRKRIGEDIKTVEFGWPVGMPVCKADEVGAEPNRSRALLH